MAINYLQAPFRLLDAVSPRLSARLAFKFFTTPRRWPAPAWEQDIARTAEAIHSDSGHTGLSWGHGPTVLLVHGWEGRVTQLGRLVAPLVNSGFRVIGFDAPAHGSQSGRALTVLQYADFLRDIAHEFGPLRGVVAHSMGASAMAFAARTRLPVDRAVFISIAKSVSGVVAQFEDLLGLAPRTRGVFRRRLESELFGTPLAPLDLAEHVPAFLPPALLLATDDDRDVPVADTQEIAARWPNARMQIALRAGGHRKVLRDDRVIDATVGFLAEGAPRARPVDGSTARRRDARELAVL